MPLFLKNPHSILAVLDTRFQDIFEIQLPAETRGEPWEAVQTSAREIDVKLVEKTGGKRRQKGTPGRTNDAGALVKEREGIPIDDLFSNVPEKAGGRGLWLALDTVQDPRNVGAIFRSAAFFGVQGILLTRDRSAPLSDAVYDVASGGMEYVPFSIQTNLSRALDLARERDLWILGTSEYADADLSQIELDRPWLLILGNEETGLRRLTLEKCDTVCKISSGGPIPSLNVSVAAGIFMQKLMG